MHITVLVLIILTTLLAVAQPLQETPETSPGDICQALKGPHPKKDVQIQPYCPDETPTPAETPKKGKPEK